MALRRRGRRARRGVVTVTHLAAEPGRPLPHRVAYAVGRPVGGAVTRNRVRRRLAALFRESVEGAGPDAPPPGDYLIGAGPDAAEASYARLGDDLRAAVTAAAAHTPEAAPGGDPC